MLKDNVKKSYDKVVMSQACEQQIKDAMLAHSESKSKVSSWYHYIPRPAMACALAVVLLLSVDGAVYAYSGNSIVAYFLSYAQNAVFTREVDENGAESATASLNTSEAVAPAEYVDGKLMFTANGEQIEITTQISETKAFTYTYVDEKEVTHYLIVGGHPEEFGYAEFMKDAKNNWIGGYFQGGVVGGDITPVWLEDAKEMLNIPW